MPSYAPWPRPLSAPGGGELTLSFVVFAPDVLRWEFSLLAEGSPLASLPRGLGVQLYTRDANPEFAEWVGGLAGEPDAPPVVAAAGAWYEVGGAVPSGPDLSALQAAWAVIRVLCRAGATAVWDGLALRWVSAEDVLAADPTHPAMAAAWGVHAGELGGGIVFVHSLGLAKFGRPDLLAFGTEENATFLGQLINGLGLDLVEGAVLESGAELEKGGVRLRVEGYAPGFNGPEVPVPFFAQPLLLVAL
jgi:hypothetical protein